MQSDLRTALALTVIALLARLSEEGVDAKPFAQEAEPAGTHFALRTTSDNTRRDKIAQEAESDDSSAGKPADAPKSSFFFFEDDGGQNKRCVILWTVVFSEEGRKTPFKMKRKKFIFNGEDE